MTYMNKFLFFALLMPLFSCKPVESDQSDTVDEITAIYLDRMNRFQAVDDPIEKAKIYVEYITEDAIWMPQNQEEVQGKENIYQWAIWFFSTYSFIPNPGESNHEKSWIEGDLAYHRFSSNGIYIIKATADTIPFSQKYLDVFMKREGKWKIAIHMWSSNNIKQSIWDLENSGN
jgi:ketosteroid isomerase-like protein